MPPSDADWILWQLADSAFPSGGFAHSSGLEAAYQTGEVRDADDLRHFLSASLLQAARLAVPFSVAAAVAGADLAGLDQQHDALVTNAVANRASRALGQGFIGAACRSLDLPQLRSRSAALHWPVAFGAVCGALGLRGEQTSRLLLFLTLRGLISAAVRLGIIGPIQGQSIQFASGTDAERLAVRAAEWGVADAAQTSPVLEVLQGVHDRLYSRLFLS